LIEDNPGDFRLINEMVKESGANVELKWAKQLSTGLANLKEESFDGLLVDLGLSDSQGIDTFKKIHDQAPQIPIVVITGLADDGLAMRAVREGAQDYLVKGQIDSNLLIRSIRHAIERKRAEEALRESEEKYRTILENIEDGYFEVDIAGNFTFFNDSLCRLLGYSRDEMMGMNNRQYTDEENAPKLYRAFNQVYRTGEPTKGFDWEVIRKDRAKRYVETSVSSIKNSSGQPIGFRGIVRDITERKQIEETLRVSESRYRSLFDGVPIGLYRTTAAGEIIDANPALVEMLGYLDWESLSKVNAADTYIDPEEQKMWQPLMEQEGIVRNFQKQLQHRDGTVIWVEENARAVCDAEGRVLFYEGSFQDITERKRAEEEMAALQEQLRQSQKMESIGRLAGGIAHDFNNLLTIIKGYSQLSLIELKEGDPLKENIEEVKKAADRAADLIRQLLAFSRRQVMEMRVLDLNILLQNLDKMLRRVIGEDIELVTLLAEDLGRVKTDPGQIEQVILNLAVNARDAMPSGGKLTIETANVELDETYARRHVAVTPGRYVMLAVSDTGVGMTPEVRDRVFEPFFTTKEKGKGTGLGLSTVYGIVKQSEGNIWIYSEPGHGTTFKIYLPQVEELLEEVKEKVVGEELPCGSETVLVVEDEEEVRKVAVRILRGQGYKVLEASNGADTLMICKEQKEPIHLILTDVVMPQMSGRQLVEQLRQVYQNLKVLYMSGYTDNTIVHHGVLEEGINYIQKPFTVGALAGKVREVLDNKEG
jgi:PAS domain S-box-containing protein